MAITKLARPVMDVVSWDLDSTLCDTRHRQHMIGDGEARKHTDWNAYSLACAGDTEGPAWALFEMLRMQTDLGHIVVSRRNHSAAMLTNRWFEDHIGHAVFTELLMLGGPLNTPELDHGKWKVAQILAYEARTGNRVVLHVDDAPIADDFAAADIPFLHIASVGSEFMTKPKPVTG